MKFSSTICYYQYAIQKKPGIKTDPRQGYYHQVLQFSHYYAYIELGLGGTQYGHNFAPIAVEDFVHFVGILIRDGVHQGGSGANNHRWKNGKSYDDEIHNTMTYTRWLQIKRVMKLNCNTSSKKGRRRI